jgi:pilus assembly protein CpaC
MKLNPPNRTLGIVTVALLSWLFAFSAAFGADDKSTTVPNLGDASETPNAGDLPSVGGETIPVEIGKPVTKSQKAREPYRKSRLTKDISEAKADRRRVLLSTGEDKVVDLDFDVDSSPAAIQVGNTQVTAVTTVRIGDQRRQLIFKPLKGGETTVTVRDNEGTIKIIFDVVVTQTNLLRRAGEIRELLRDVDGIDVKVIGSNIVIDGEVLTTDDFARLRAVTNQKGYAENVLVLAKIAPLALTMLSKKIQEDISAFAPNVKTRIVNGLLFLEGTVDQLDQARRAEQVARLYFPDVRPGNQLAANDATATSLARRDYVYNFIVLNPQPPKKNEKLVKLMVHAVDLNKDYSRAFGFTWNPGFTADPSISYGQQANGSTGANSTSFTATLSSLIPKLKSAQDAGFARVLKQGTIITKSGVQGIFRDEAKIYQAALASGNGGAPTQAQPVPITFTAKLTPRVLGSGEEIEVGISIQSDSLLGYNQGSPIVGTKSFESTLYIKSGESAAIGGLESTTVDTAFNKDGLGNGTFQDTSGTSTTQPLFNLNRSKNFKKSKGQFVIFITPQIIDDASQGSDELKRNFRVKVK